MKWMTAREFLRGGYRQITEPTVISNHGYPMFTVFPQSDWTRQRARWVVDANKPGAFEEAEPVEDDDARED